MVHSAPDYSATITTLREQEVGVKDDVDRLQQELDELRAKHESLTQAISALERLTQASEAGATPSPVAPESSAEKTSESPRPGEQGVVDLTPPRGQPWPPKQRRKVQSTKMVAEYLWSVREPQTRAELLAHFTEIGVAANWANPTNALATAILRAKDSGAVVELPDGRLQHAKHVRQTEIF